MERLKISSDPLFPVTIFQIGGLLYDVIVPALAFCSMERPFSDLALSTFSAAERHAVVDRLSVHVEALESLGRTNFLRKLDRKERPRWRDDVFCRFVAAVSAKYPDAQIHLLLSNHVLNPYDLPGVQRWLAVQPRLHLHWAPVSMHGQRLPAIAEHWLKAIAQWPMQASLIAGIEEMIRLLDTFPADRLVELVV
jgi:hypothetical protein